MNRFLAVLLAVAASAVAGCRPAAPAAAPPPAPAVVVAEPEQRTVTEYYVYTGTTEAIETVEVRARVSGTLSDVHFEPATTIAMDTPLFTIDPEPYQIAVDAATAEVKRTEAALQLAEATKQRVEVAFEREAASDIEVLEATATAQQREAEKLAAEARLRDAERELGYTSISAPIAGRVSRPFVDVGNLVGYGEPTLLTRIDQMDPIWIYFDVSERIVLEYLAVGRNGNVGEQQDAPPVEVALANSAEGEFPFAGTINWVDNAVDEATGTVRVRAEVPNADHSIFPGLFVRARAPRRELVDALLVPEDAIISDLAGKSLYVVNDKNVVEQRMVEVGPREGAMRVILEGIEAGDRVIVAGIQKARPGAPVTIVPAESDAKQD